MCSTIDKIKIIQEVDDWYGFKEASKIIDQIIYRYTILSLQNKDEPPGEELAEHINLLNLLKESFSAINSDTKSS